MCRFYNNILLHYIIPATICDLFRTLDGTISIIIYLYITDVVNACRIVYTDKSYLLFLSLYFTSICTFFSKLPILDAYIHIYYIYTTMIVHKK